MSELKQPPSTSNNYIDVEQKKKRRNIGQYVCPDCGKIFTRTDHLGRHRLNHKPKELFECDFMLEVIGGGKRKCGKTFVRRDLKDRHVRRHMSSGSTSRVNWSSVSGSSVSSHESSLTIDSPRMRSMSIKKEPSKNLNNQQNALVRSQSAAESPLQISNLIHAAESNDTSSFIKPELSHSNQSSNGGFGDLFPNGRGNGIDVSDEKKAENTKEVYPLNTMQSQNELISWLFNDSSPNNIVSPMDIPMQSTAENNTSIANASIFPSGFDLGQYTNGQGFQSYELAQNNLFRSEINPLDELLLKSYNQGLGNVYNEENGKSIDSLDTSETPIDHKRNGSKVSFCLAEDNRLTSFNFSLPSTVSLTSPGSTNDSNATPTPTNDIFSPTLSTNLQRRIHEYGSRFNIITNEHIYIDKMVLHQLFVSLPALQRNFVESIFNDKILIEDRFSYYLSVYWLVFHPQFNILHKSSFKTKEAEPLLILSMILVGCNYCTPADKPDHLSQPRSKSPEYKLALAIATPLRFAVFQHDGFKSPVKLWVLQSLNLLEWSEKNFLSRAMHERAHIHHSTTVQLMRRSHVLGGNPASDKPNSSTEDEFDADKVRENHDKNDYQLYKKWVESESFKRVTYMTFYLDIADYVKFRHNPVIFFHQLQLLKLPCEDELWEATDVNGSFYKIMKKQKKLASTKSGLNPNESFLNVVKKLLKVSSVLNLVPSPFTRKILFGGLLSIMYQMQSFELQNSSSLIALPSNSNFQEWKDLISIAIDNFSRSVKENCKTVKLNKSSMKLLDGGISTCKFSIYHLAHIVGLGDLNTYDCSIFCGSPANQNVIITMKDRLIVERKLSNIWSKDFHKDMNGNDVINLKGIVHCYIFLWETLLDHEKGQQKKEIWNPGKDYFDSMFALSLVMQILWSYCFLTSGIESTRYADIEDSMYSLTFEKLVDLSAESGYEYLQRVRQEFMMNLRRENLHHSHAIENLYKADSKISPHEITSKYGEILSNISNKQNISGLCFLIGTRLYNSQWELVRENGKLIINCGMRSIGKKEVFCSDVFDVELLD
ncbi:hypothetical protein PSN45_003332 [Yamadazyma tenuis]|uniref:C2H2-type domain-containing protein n=1 Tax=Candida tenuis (strain ATCC 10573 / BCRC 21748 / CBS 615 / JCM 9827 / NBRC 10315 / NRRL Y-1498 / VKM Y-70) TaxID=590646 RepID=G3AYJ3_CANTC|nr:uncharacterized protein CANTEDRAFT_101537 [Yamadazyma tenuis ATCC 10573]EGV65866.1 hypothetical protein CANTEDRAFT_101537 [Yamadazyma tenuis ATCC 10573]WEJ95805.1 hypothetical protein PSN45_003332 [Yamadazyma tenuis]